MERVFFWKKKNKIKWKKRECVECNDYHEYN